MGSPGTPSRCIPTCTSNRHFTPVSTLSSRDSSGSSPGNYSGRGLTPKESLPMPGFGRIEPSLPFTGQRTSSSPSSPPSTIPVFEKMGKLPLIIHQGSPPGRSQNRMRETTLLPVYVPNSLPNPLYSTPSQSSKQRSQLQSLSGLN